MIEKIIALPVKAGYNIGRYGIEKGAKAGSRLLPALRNYLIPAAQDVEEINYCSKLEKKNKDIAKYIKHNPEKKQTLDDCIEQSVESNSKARNWAATIDTLDKTMSGFGLAGDYLILMTGATAAPAGYAIGLVEEAVEMALLKGPFMAYYAKKNGMKGMKRIPGWLAGEFLSHVLPFGDLLDLRNNYVKAVDKDITNQAADLFREKEGLKQPAGWLHGMWNNVKSYFSSTPSKQPDKKQTPVVDAPLIPLPRYDPRDETAVPLPITKTPLVPLPAYDPREDKERIYVDEKGLIHVFLNGEEKVYNCNGILPPGTYPNGKYELMAKPAEQNIEQKVAA